MYINYSIHMIQPGQSHVESHVFQYWLILSGNAVLKTSDREFYLEPHTLLELPQGHGAQLQVEPEQAFTLGIMELMDTYTSQRIIRQIPASQTHFIRQLFFFAIDFGGVSIPRKSAIQTALDHLVFEAIVSCGIIVNPINPAIYHSIDEINKNYKKSDFDLDLLIKKSGYSASHFRKLFKNVTGSSPLSFLHLLRIDCAKSLMRRSGHEMSLADIANQSGFDDPYYFSRLFKKYEKKSPSEYLSSLERSQEAHE